MASSSAPEEMRGTLQGAVIGSLHKKLSWLTLLRLVIISVLLAGTVLTSFGATEELARATRPIYVLVVVIYVASLGFSLSLRANFALPAIAILQIALDVGAAAAIVAMTGRSDSVFVFLFSLAIVNGSILLFRRGAIVATLLSLAAYAAVAYGGGPSPEPYVAFMHGAAYVATAVLASYLAEQLRSTGEQLRSTGERLWQMQDAVKRAELLAQLGELSAGLAHEIRNPLASLTGAIELIRDRQPGGSEDARLIEIVLREAERLNNLVSRFHEFTRPAPPVRRQVDLFQLIGETSRVFAHSPGGGGVRIAESAARTIALGDPDQLRQVLWNLLVNAAEAGGETQAAIEVSCGQASGDRAFFSVADRGKGIRPADRDRLFKPFFTTKRDGTGLGLAIVHRIIDGHGGVIDVESLEGGGTIFTVRLPADKAADRA